MRSMVLAMSTTNRACVPVLMASSSSRAETSNVTLRPFDRNHLGRDLDSHAGQARGQMLHRDLDADRILAGVGVLQDQLAAGVLDVEDHRRRGIDPRLLAHETDCAGAIDGDRADQRDARLQAWLHCFP